MIIELTDKNFEENVLNKTQPLIIDFYAEWCGPCKMIGFALDALAEEYEGKATVAKVDVDVNPELTSKYGVRGMPTVLFLKDGEVIDKHVGATSKSILEAKLKEAL